MKICILGDGSSIHIHRWLKFLTSRNHEVHLVTYRISPGFESNCHVHIVSRSNIFSNSYTANLIWDMFHVMKTIKIIKPDVLHAHYISDYALGGLMSGIHPLLVTAWGSDVLVMPEESSLNSFITKVILKKSDIVLTINYYIRGFLIKKYNLPESKVVTIPWGVDTNIFKIGYVSETNEVKNRLKLDKDLYVLLSPRHMLKHFNIDKIINAFAEAIKKCPNIILILLKGASTDTDYKNYIYSLIKSLKITDNIKIFDECLDEIGMATLYNVSNAFISIPNSDGFSSTIMEGMACGSIPIVSNLEVYHQYLEHNNNAFFVNIDDTYDITKKIIFTIEHPEHVMEIRKHNREIIEKHENWALNALKMEQLYLDIISNKYHE